MLTVRRAAYLLIAACIALAIPASFGVLPAWLLLIGLLGGRLYMLTADPFDPLVQAERRAFAVSVGAWTLLHALVALTAPRFQVNIALPLLSLPLMYWLMTRFSRIDAVWARLSMRVTTLLIALAGIGWYSGATWLALYVSPVCVLITAAHAYRAFSDQNGSRTLAAHWLALMLLLWIGASLIGGADAALRGYWLTFAALALVLGMGSQITADWRGENRRITGLSAYWLVAFGVIFSRLTPDPALWGLLPPLGVLVYAAQFVIRRPPGLLSSGSEPPRPH